MTPNDILDALMALLPAQFEVVLLRTGIPVHYLSSASAPQAVRATEVVRYLEQQKSLDEVSAVLSQILRKDSPVVVRGGSLETASATAATRCFVSYARSDRVLFEELCRHLASFLQRGDVEVFDDSQIAAGEPVQARLFDEINRAELILLLVSADYLAGNGLFELESRAMKRYEEGAARVVPVIARSCDWSAAPFRKLQTLPRDGQAVFSRRDRDAAWVDVVNSLLLVIKDLRERHITSPRQAPRDALTAPLRTVERRTEPRKRRPSG